MRHLRIHLIATTLLVGIAVAAPAVADATRRSTTEPVPPGPTVLERPLGFGAGSAGRSSERRSVARRSDDVDVGGGDDVVIDTFDLDVTSFQYVELAAAENGDLYSAVYASPTPEAFHRTLIRRSADDGQTWQTIGDLSVIDPESQELTALHVVEGIVDRVYVFYQARDEDEDEGPVSYTDLRVAQAALGVASPTWEVSTVMDPFMVGMTSASVTDDSEEFPDAWLYVVSEGLGDEPGIWFSRSPDGGITWTTPVRILSSTAGSAEQYVNPAIEFGRGGRLHVVSTYSAPLDNSVRYIRSTTYGAGWSSTEWELTSGTDGVLDDAMDVATDPVGPGVTVLVTQADPFIGAAPRLFRSLDEGASWSVDDVTDVAHLDRAFAADWSVEGDALFVMGMDVEEGTGLSRTAHVEAPLEDLTAFSAPQVFGDFGVSASRASFGLHPTRRPPAMAAYVSVLRPPFDVDIAFDGAWRGGPGYPDYEPGFPFAMAAGARRTPPALVDLDGDAQLEIVCADTDGEVYVVEPDGSLAPGWPVNVGPIVDDDAPVAVGDLDGDGVPSIVAGISGVGVTALAPDGTVRPGFPVDLDTNFRTYVAIGDFEAGIGRQIVAVTGDRLARIDGEGTVTFAPSPLPGGHVGPPAIGDVDADGSVDIVYSYLRPTGETGVHVLAGDLSGVLASRDLGGAPVNAVSLGDLDGDGDLEITVPQANGTLQVLHHDLTDVAGFPYVTGDDESLSRVTIESLPESGEPALVFSNVLGRVHVVGVDGTDASGFPVNAGSDALQVLLGAPILTSVDTGLPSTIVTGSSDDTIWGFREADASLPAGWPRVIGDAIEATAAAGDIDADGNNEIVFLGNEQLHVFDVEVPDGASGSVWWPMSGADPQRTGCADCSAVATSVEAAPLANAVHLRLASGNPVRGAAEFAFVLATSATVELQVFDLRGRRVRDMGGRRMQAGEHRVVFDGRDDRGRKLAQGTYLARLVVDDVVRRHDAKKFVFLD